MQIHVFLFYLLTSINSNIVGICTFFNIICFHTKFCSFQVSHFSFIPGKILRKKKGELLSSSYFQQLSFLLVFRRLFFLSISYLKKRRGNFEEKGKRELVYTVLFSVPLFSFPIFSHFFFHFILENTGKI